MLKVIATVAAIISSLIAITLYTTTIPDVQKQATDNAAAIEQNAEAIETLSSVKLYYHYITIESSDALIYTKVISQTETYSIDLFIEYLNNNEITDENNVISATGRKYLTGGTTAASFGLYTSNDDLYSVFIEANSASPSITSYLLENITLTDISVLLN